MTACLAAADDGEVAVFQEHLDLVRGADVPMYWINACCDQASLVQRIRSKERVHSSKSKLTDVSTLQELLDAHTLIEPQELNDASTKLIVRPLDVNGEIEESVNALLAIVGLDQAVELASRNCQKTRSWSLAVIDGNSNAAMSATNAAPAQTQLAIINLRRIGVLRYMLSRSYSHSTSFVFTLSELGIFSA